MAFTLENSTIEVQRGFLQFSTVVGVDPATVYRRMLRVYAEDCILRVTMRNWASSSGNSLTIRPTARTCFSAIALCLVPLKTSEREHFNLEDELKDAVKDRSCRGRFDYVWFRITRSVAKSPRVNNTSHSHKNSKNKESFCSFINGIVLFKSIVNALYPQYRFLPFSLNSPL
ncbi:hypothetical protein TNCV_4107301 [Trichonephila clavipes]|nr:hypothetical protein TNCV_4107301 [Trichonephila clavipes]